jgi:hypothetical protein
MRLDGGLLAWKLDRRWESDELATECPRRADVQTNIMVREGILTSFKADDLRRSRQRLSFGDRQWRSFDQQAIVTLRVDFATI